MKFHAKTIMFRFIKPDPFFGTFLFDINNKIKEFDANHKKDPWREWYVHEFFYA